MKYIFQLTIIVFLSSCASHIGTISSSSIDKNIIYEDMSFGVAQSNKVFGLGGLSKDALILEAKFNLLNYRPLKSNESYLNFTIDLKKTHVFFFTRTKATISADVVSFSNLPVKEPFSEKYKALIASKNKINAIFNVGDSVINQFSFKGKIISCERKEKVRVLYKDSKGNLRSKKSNLKKLFVEKNNINGFNLNDTIIFNASQTEGIYPKPAVILGFGNNQLLIKLNNSEKSVIKYSDILPKDYLTK